MHPSDPAREKEDISGRRRRKGSVTLDLREQKGRSMINSPREIGGGFGGFSASRWNPGGDWGKRYIYARQQRRGFLLR